MPAIHGSKKRRGKKSASPVVNQDSVLLFEKTSEVNDKAGRWFFNIKGKKNERSSHGENRKAIKNGAI